MKMRTTLMILLMLFHTSTVWAMSMPVNQCPPEMQSMPADIHAMHADMQSEDSSSMQHSCCEGEMDETACQLQCAATAAAIMQTLFTVEVNETPGRVADISPAHRLPPHQLSLLRPPAPVN